MGLRHLFEPEGACAVGWRVPKARPELHDEARGRQRRGRIVLDKLGLTNAQADNPKLFSRPCNQCWQAQFPCL